MKTITRSLQSLSTVFLLSAVAVGFTVMPFVSVLIPTAQAAHPGTIVYVDAGVGAGGDGTAGSPYDTLQEGVDHANSGDTVKLMSNFTLTASEGQVNITDPLTLDGDGYTISASFAKTGNSNNSVIGITGTNDVIVKNITIDGSGGTDLHGINVYLSTSVEINNVTILDINRTGVVVNGSEVTVKDISTNGSGWHAMNVDLGSGVTTSAVLTVEGVSSHGEIWPSTPHIYIDDTTKDVTVNDVEGQYATTTTQQNDRVYYLDSSVEDGEETGELNLVASKIVCESESDLPNWNNQADDIDENTAQAFVNASEGSCWLESGWEFQWIGEYLETPQGDGEIRGEKDDWNTFGSTDVNGVATTTFTLDAPGHFTVREVLQEGYIPFSDAEDDGPEYSAEFYCANDVKKYDNNENVWGDQGGGTYYCVAFNVPEETQPGPICEVGEQWSDEVVSSEQGTNKVAEAISEDRSDAGSVLGEPDGDFWSIGQNGTITVKFNEYILDQDVLHDGGDVSIHEVTGGDRSTYPEEKVEVEVSQNGSTWYSIGEASSLNEVTYLDISPTGLDWIQYVRLNDSTNYGPHGDNGDGFEVDAIDGVEGVCEQPVSDIPQCENADQRWADNVVDYSPGLGYGGAAIASDRQDPTKATGPETESDDAIDFVSLGFGGEIILGFDEAIPDKAGDDLRIYETTFGDESPSSHPETADVYGSQTGTLPGDFKFLGSVTIDEGAGHVKTVDIANGGLSEVRFVKIVDTSTESDFDEISDDADGFDVAGVEALTCGDSEIGQCVATATTDLNNEASQDNVAAVITEFIIDGVTYSDGDSFDMFVLGDADADNGSVGDDEVVIKRTADGFELYYYGSGTQDVKEFSGSFMLDNVDAASSTISAGDEPLEFTGTWADEININTATGEVTFTLYSNTSNDSFVVSGLKTECSVDDTDDSDNDDQTEDSIQSNNNGQGGGGGVMLNRSGSNGNPQVLGAQDDNRSSNGQVAGVSDARLSDLLDQLSRALRGLIYGVGGANVGFPSTGDGSLSDRILVQ